MSSDFQRRFQGKTEMLNKQGINGIVGSSNTPIDKPQGAQMVNVNQFQPYPNDDMYPNVNNQYNQYGMNMQELNNMEDNLNRQMDDLNLDIQRTKGTPTENRKRNKEKRNSSAVLLAKNNIVGSNTPSNKVPPSIKPT